MGSSGGVWVGQGGSLDGTSTRINPWYGLFPQEWLEGGGSECWRGGAGRGGVGTAMETTTAAGGLLPAAVCGYVEHGVLTVDSSGQTCTHEG